MSNEWGEVPENWDGIVVPADEPAETQDEGVCYMLPTTGPALIEDADIVGEDDDEHKPPFPGRSAAQNATAAGGNASGYEHYFSDDPDKTPPAGINLDSLRPPVPEDAPGGIFRQAVWNFKFGPKWLRDYWVPVVSGTLLLGTVLALAVHNAGGDSEESQPSSKTEDVGEFLISDQTSGVSHGCQIVTVVEAFERGGASQVQHFLTNNPGFYGGWDESARQTKANEFLTNGAQLVETEFGLPSVNFPVFRPDFATLDSLDPPVYDIVNCEKVEL